MLEFSLHVLGWFLGVLGSVGLVLRLSMSRTRQAEEGGRKTCSGRISHAKAQCNALESRRGGSGLVSMEKGKKKGWTMGDVNMFIHLIQVNVNIGWPHLLCSYGCPMTGGCTWAGHIDYRAGHSTIHNRRLK